VAEVRPTLKCLRYATFSLRESVDHEQRIATSICQGKPYGKLQECREASEEEEVRCQEGRFAEEDASEEEGCANQESRLSEEGWCAESRTSEEEGSAGENGSLANKLRQRVAVARECALRGRRFKLCRPQQNGCALTRSRRGEGTCLLARSRVDRIQPTSAT
jgi:hypothetical protein